MRKSLLISFLALVALAGAVVVADDANVFFLDGEGEAFDLADLIDGETREFGTGEDRMAATRDGDTVSLTRVGRGGSEKELRVTCHLGTDTCRVITTEGSDRVAVSIERSIDCEAGQADCAMHDIDVIAMAGAPGLAGSRRVFVKTIEECEGDDCGKHEIRIVGTHGADALHWVGEDGAGGPHVMVFRSGDGSPHGVHMRDGKARMVCPEGDASLWVDGDETDQTFLCPKHNISMEEKTGGLHHRVLIETKE